MLCYAFANYSEMHKDLTFQMISISLILDSGPLHAPTRTWHLIAVIHSHTLPFTSTRNTHLSLLVKCHDDDSCAILLNGSGFLQEVLLTRFEADAVDNALALATSQSCLHHREIGRVDAQWHLPKNAPPLVLSACFDSLLLTKLKLLQFSLTYVNTEGKSTFEQ